MGQEMASVGVWQQRMSLAEWSREYLSQIAETRKHLEHWVQELKRAVEGTIADSVQRECSICECTRMVVMAGETLHNSVSIFVTLSGRPAPATGWDANLASRVDAAMARAAKETTTDPYSANSKERFEYVRGKWASWCPQLNLR